SAYGESRTNDFADEVLFFGLQPFLLDYLGKPLSQADIEEADELCAAHGVPFNCEGWQAILDDHGGYLPIEISPLEEGRMVPIDPHVRVIQGDGMNIESIARLVQAVGDAGFAVDNIAFGMGGGLLQLVNRDTLRFAMKANAMQVEDGSWHDVSKKPATDPSKASKAGRQAVVEEGGRLVARKLDDIDPAADLLKPVWRNGKLLVRHSFDEVRERGWS
ncbi:MAG: nicotinamide phosphoribosyltransferase domain-containing protein, partial [Qipengyuania vulgaris]